MIFRSIGFNLEIIFYKLVIFFCVLKFLYRKYLGFYIFFIVFYGLWIGRLGEFILMGRWELRIED